jgi:hypothetical protein
MGIAVGDADGDGIEEIFVSNYSDQENAFYHSTGAGMFEDWASLAGLADTSFRFLGWGATFFDVENDGDLDLMVGNGHVYPEVDIVDPLTSYRQRDLLFVNDGYSGFDPWSPPAGSSLAEQVSSRTVVRVDIDNDGDSDLLVNRIEDPPMLLRNQSEAGSWLGIVLRGTTSNRDGAGAMVRVIADDLEQVQTQRLGSSYMSSEDPRLLFGLGARTGAKVEVVWPDGSQQVWQWLEAGHYHLVQEDHPPQEDS